MPFGEARELGFNNQPLARLAVANSRINSKGMFFYSGPPALGNLIQSTGVATAGTDPFGNVYQAGDTVYAGPSTNFAQLETGQLNFQSTGDNLQGQVSGGGGAVSIRSGAAGVGNSQVTGQFAQSADISHAPELILSSNSSVAAMLDFVQGSSNPATPTRPALTWPPGVPNTQVLVSPDGTRYPIGHFTSFSTTDELVNALTFATVCGGGTTIAAGKYRVHAELTCVQGPNAASNHFRLGFTGTISQVRMKMVSGQDATNIFLATTTSNNGLLASHAWAAGSTYEVTLHGIIVSTSTGTLSIQAAMDLAGDTFTVLALSDFHLEPIG